MRFASLGSGSRGNALVVEAGKTRVLLDCGFGLKETESRLARLGLAPDNVNAILVTHEHDDHVGGVSRFASSTSIMSRSSSVSPMPMMPPQQTEMPALLTALRVSMRSS